MAVKEISEEVGRVANQREEIDRLCRSVLPDLKRIGRSGCCLHLLFIGCLLIETIVLVGVMLFSPGSTFVPFSLVIVVLTVFIYLIVISYLKINKPRKLKVLQDRFIHLCKQALPTDLPFEDYHLLLAHATYRFAKQLKNEEESISFEYRMSKRTLDRLIRRCIQLCYGKDVRQMKEILFSVSVREHLLLIRQCPTSLEAHGSLANAYIGLANTYDDKEGPFYHRCGQFWEKAVEEFKVMDVLSPKTPWVQARMADCHHKLGNTEEEIACCEKLLEQCPNDRQVMFRLGMLYFKEGRNAQGLQIYQDLKKFRFSKADELVKYYEQRRDAIPFL